MVVFTRLLALIIFSHSEQHWKEASKLLLSKHQQVQLLEAAAILKAAQSGTSLPEEKGFWSVPAPPRRPACRSQSVLSC